MPSQFPQELIEAFADRRATVFVGAGVSVAAGLPTWKQLIEPLAFQIEDSPRQSFSPLDIAQYYVNEHGPRRLAEVLGQALDKQLSPTEIHDLIVTLPIGRIYTTNFDNLIEGACARAGLTWKPVWRTSQLDMKADRVIYKLHGDLTDPSSIVITAEDFEEYLTRHEAMAKIIESAMLERTVLFLGYSFNDPDIRTILRGIRRAAESFARNHFIVLAGPGKAVTAELNRRGLKVIALERAPDLSSALAGWLKELKRRVTVQPEAKAHHNLSQSSRELVGREEGIKDLLAAIREHRQVALVGPSGVGKTSLALKVGQECARSSSEPGFYSVIWFSAREKPETDSWLDDVLNTIGSIRGYPRIKQRAFNDKKALVELLLEKPTLLILDNFDPMNDSMVREWLSGLPPASRVLVTSTAEPGAIQPPMYAYPLQPLVPGDALKLLKQFAIELNAEDTLRVAGSTPEDLVEAVNGNPQALKLLLGLVQSKPSALGDVVRELRNVRDSVDQLFTRLFERSWDFLSDDAERLLLVTPIFLAAGAIRRSALEDSTGLSDFETALRQVQQFGLIETTDGNDRYLIHSKTRAFAQKKAEERPKFMKDAQERCAKHYLQFVRSVVVRPNPAVPYWNALVTERMRLLDPELRMIRWAVEWADTNSNSDLLIDFVMVLVHYLDSRFLNQDRLLYVQKAIALLSKTDRFADEALLRIDALGWTYVEESKWKEAHAEIDAGIELTERISGREKENLLALAKAWKARALIEEFSQGGSRDPKLKQRAQELIAESLSIEEARGSHPWIRMRINMAAGDIALKFGKYEQALDYFQRAAAAADQYGGEGGGYQISPRLGMALISLGRDKEAEIRFNAVNELEGIRIGNLYGLYGNALVALSRGQHNRAGELIHKAQEELERNGGSNLIWSLLKDVYSKLQPKKSGTGSQYDAAVVREILGRWNVQIPIDVEAFLIRTDIPDDVKGRVRGASAEPVVTARGGVEGRRRMQNQIVSEVIRLEQSRLDGILRRPDHGLHEIMVAASRAS